jgi:hypothetical protein
MTEQNSSNFLKHAFMQFQPSAFLLAAQFLQLLAYMFFDHFAYTQNVIGIIGELVLLLVVWVITRSPGINWIAWLLAAPAAVLSIIAAVFPQTHLIAWASVLQGMLYFYGAGSLIAYMMEDNEVTRDELFAVGATFTLLAWGYGFFYAACQSWLPGSFYSTVVSGRPLTFLELLSVSFTNLTATGLSDIVAVSSPARALVMLEQFSGIGYVAVVVSRLIGMTLKHKKKSV